MAGTETQAISGRNLVLRAVPRDDQERLGARMELVRVAPGEVLCDADAPIPHVCFPLTGVFSILAVAKTDRVIEVATVGREGLVGVPVFLGAVAAPTRVLCHVDSEALRMPSAAFREEIRRGGPLRDAVELYVQRLFDQIVRTAICNNVHSVEQRCARWLAATHGRAGPGQLRLTQELLGRMLGVRRSTVNGVVGRLQASGLIAYSRGRISVRDPAGLEAAACECYGAMRDSFARPGG